MVFLLDRSSLLSLSGQRQPQIYNCYVLSGTFSCGPLLAPYIQWPSVSNCHFALLSGWMFFSRCMTLCLTYRMPLEDCLSPKTPEMTCLSFHDKAAYDNSEHGQEEAELFSSRKEEALGRRDAKQNFSTKMWVGSKWMEGRGESGLTYHACNWPPVFNSWHIWTLFLYKRLSTHIRYDQTDCGECPGQPWELLFRIIYKPYSGSHFSPDLSTTTFIITIHSLLSRSLCVKVTLLQAFAHGLPYALSIIALHFLPISLLDI